MLPPSGAGGPLIDAMNALNDYRNNTALRRYNEAKAEYAPQTLLAQAASQATYANNMAPQYIAKMLQDAGIKGNLSDAQLAELLRRAQNAGLGQNPGLNALNQMMYKAYENMNHKPQNAISWLFNKFKNMIHPEQQQAQNALLNPMQPLVMSQQNANIARPSMPPTQQQPESQSKTPYYIDENGNPVDKDETITPVTEEEAQALEALNNGKHPLRWN